MWHVVVVIAGISVLGWFVKSFVPDGFYSVTLFFFLVTVIVFFLSLFIFKIVRRASLVTVGIVIWLLLRMAGLREIYYPILLGAILISLESLLQKR